MLKKGIIIALVLGMCAAGREAAAFEMLEDFFGKLNLGYEEGAILGMGVGYSSRPYEDIDPLVVPAPRINLQYKKLFIEGSTVGLYLHKGEKYRWSIVGAPRAWGYEPDDSDALTGMTKRGWSFDMGLQGEVKCGLFTTEMTFLSDVTDEHNGQEVGVAIKREFLDGAVTPRVGVRWHSDNLIDHYFGVKDSEARAGRPAYEAEDSASFIGGATVALPIGEKWAWVTDAWVQVFGSEVDDSPIVEDNTVFNVVSGIVYRY